MGKHYQEAKESFKPIPKYNPKYEPKKIAKESFKPIKNNPRYEQKKIAKESFKPIKYNPKYEQKKIAAESFKSTPKNNPKYEKKKIAAESFKKSSLNVEIPQLINTEAIRFNPQSTTFFKPGEIKHELITRIPPKQIISNEKENKSLPNNEPTKQKKTRKNNKKETKTTDTSKPKRKPTEKQLAALARGREIRLQNIARRKAQKIMY